MIAVSGNRIRGCFLWAVGLPIALLLFAGVGSVIWVKSKIAEGALTGDSSTICFAQSDIQKYNMDAPPQKVVDYYLRTAIAQHEYESGGMLMWHARGFLIGAVLSTYWDASERRAMYQEMRLAKRDCGPAEVPIATVIDKLDVDAVRGEIKSAVVSLTLDTSLRWHDEVRLI